MNQYGIYEKALISKEFENSLDYAKAEGYNYWEIAIDNERKNRLDWDDAQIENIIKMCHKTRMPIFNMVLSIHRDYPLGSSDLKIRNKAMEYLYKAVNLASKLGIRTIQIAGYYNSGPNMNDGSINYFIDALKVGSMYASSKGIMLGIENMDYDLTDATAILKVVEEINNPYLGMFLDVGNFAANKLNPIKELQIGLPHLVGLHLKEANLGVYRRIQFGKGIVKFSDIFKYLTDKEYNGYLGVEMWNDNNPDSLSEIKYAINWLEEEKKY